MLPTDLLGDLRVIRVPNSICWPNGGAANGFIDIYDWDRIVLQGSCSSVPLQVHLDLCVGIFPCFIHLFGKENAAVLLRDEGRISCTIGNGCEGIVLDSLSILSESVGLRAPYPVVQIEGSPLSIHNCTFSGCYSSADGGCVQAFDQAFLNLTSSRFSRSSTSGLGGAVSVVGSQIYLKNCRFLHCHSDSGGGAIWASTFYLFGSSVEVETNVHIDASTFEFCTTFGNGGSILASDTSNLYETITLWVRSTCFVESSSIIEGGAVSLSGDSVTATIFNSSFTDCSSSKNGGAISAEAASQLFLFDAIFSSNTASGNGGGAIYLNDASLFLDWLKCFENRAPNGGGGVILHAGNSAVMTAKTYSSPQNLASSKLYRMDLGDLDYALVGTEAVIQIFEDLKVLGQDGRVCYEGSSNSAVYGDCLASMYHHLEVLGLPVPEAPANPGIPFTITVIKMDVYNQTILSDSISLLQILSSVGLQLQNDPTVSISGEFISSLKNGSADFTIVLNPTFSKINFLNDMTILTRQPFIFLKGIDAFSISDTMQSEPTEVYIASGGQVCPEGYVLILDKAGKGSCSECGSGTYSVNPLAGISPSQPACFTCPLNGVCTGGYSVELPLGMWIVVSGYYKLICCPEGHQLVNENALGVFLGTFRHATRVRETNTF